MRVFQSPSANIFPILAKKRPTAQIPFQIPSGICLRIFSIFRGRFTKNWPISYSFLFIGGKPRYSSSDNLLIFICPFIINISSSSAVSAADLCIPVRDSGGKPFTVIRRIPRDRLGGHGHEVYPCSYPFRKRRTRRYDRPVSCRKKIYLAAFIASSSSLSAAVSVASSASLYIPLLMSVPNAFVRSQ